MARTPREHSPLRLALATACLALTAAVAAGPAQAGIPSRPPSSLDELIRWYPTRDANEAALDVERLSAELGISLVPRWIPQRHVAGDPREDHLNDLVDPQNGPTRPEPDALAERAYREVKQALEEYGRVESAVAGGPVNPPPPGVSDFLRANSDALSALRRRLLAGDLPRWEQHLERFPDVPLPNLLGIMSLQKVLIADALGRGAAGDTQGAAETLEASWALNTALTGEPTLISQLITLAVARMQAGVLRRVPGMPAVWGDRLLADHHGSLFQAMRIEGWTLIESPPIEFDRDPYAPMWKELFQWAVRPILQPIQRQSSRVTGQALLEAVERVAAAGPLCEVDLSAQQEELTADLPVWNRTFVGMTDGFSPILGRLARWDVDAEMTLRILDLQTAYRRTGAWPARLPGRTDSRACPSRRWVYDVSDGSASLTLEPPPPQWKDQIGTILPTRWTSAAPDSATPSPKPALIRPR